MNSGTPSAGNGAGVEAETWVVAVAGKVHATSVAVGSDRLFWDPTGATVAGTDWGLGAAGVTQQSICWQSQQAQTALAGKKDFGADANT